ncbi:MAG: hypothetical protein KME59_12025 [Trichormus sp. ATA11-4-KO1]|jgi:hypothetical protein|nr:hypothetical protein [Trichormus sp. ATA11-4-KO1]
MKRVSQPSMKERLEARDWNFYSALSTPLRLRSGQAHSPLSSQKEEE